MAASQIASTVASELPRVDALPRLGFVGVGWIGLHRLRSVIAAECSEIVGIADVHRQAADEAVAAAASQNARVMSFEELLKSDLDGIVIATPNSQHAAQALAALDHGIHVFCQKPLARTAAEVTQIVRRAREHDRLLAVDFCYRNVEGVRQMKSHIQHGLIGRVYAADLTFHNAYGPDKPWFFDRRSAGGGCVMDLGIHLIDLALWMLDFPQVRNLSSRRYRNGKRLDADTLELENYGTLELDLANDVEARIACSWHLHAGRDAVIEAIFYGTGGSLRLRNLNGSFFDFTIEHCEGTRCRTIASPGPDWGGVAICEWARQLAGSPSFDPTTAHIEDVHRVLDEIYRR